MSNAWIYQQSKELQEKGPEGASWYVGFYEPDGRKRRKSFGPGSRGKNLAEKYKKKVEAELMTGTYQQNVRKKWAEFRKEYTEKIVAGLAPRSRPEVETALNHFQRIVKPVLVYTLDTGRVDDFVARRRQEAGKRPGCLVSPATVNKDLRHVKAALRVALEWGYLQRLPRFRMERGVLKKLPTYVTGEHFAAIYSACNKARFPDGLSYPAADWWRALIVMGYMTGWRISDMLGLDRADVDLDAGEAITRAKDNKGKRDERVKLHPVVVDHLKRLAAFTPKMFPWLRGRRIVDDEFHRIQLAVGIGRRVKVTAKRARFEGMYGFHDLRRAFATMNADKLTPDALQTLMRHRSYTTTQVYINLGRQMDEAVASLHVPEIIRRSGG